MDIRYIRHSGFLVETASCVYIFDYYKGSLPGFDISKPVVVFSSHAHHDHYNPNIFSELCRAGAKQVYAVLSHDISEDEYPESVPVTKVLGDGEYTLDTGEKLVTLTSTDEGVAFLLYTAEGILYHAGDLNDWRWEPECEADEEENKKMCERYRSTICKLRDIPIDAAFVPLDPRQGQFCGEGLLYFLENCTAASVYPMHFWGRDRIADEFVTAHPEYKTVITKPI